MADVQRAGQGTYYTMITQLNGTKAWAELGNNLNKVRQLFLHFADYYLVYKVNCCVITQRPEGRSDLVGNVTKPVRSMENHWVFSKL